MNVLDFPNYTIYPDGRCWSSNGKGRYLKPARQSSGYLFYDLHSGSNGRKNYLIHRLISDHFIPNPDNKPQVDHIDGDKDNNNVSNLRWCTSHENCQNRKSRCTNTSGHDYISWANREQSWVFKKTFDKDLHSKYFKNLDDAIAYKKEYLKTLPDEYLRIN